MPGLADELKELFELRQCGALTEAEFMQAKRMVLERSRGQGVQEHGQSATEAVRDPPTPPDARLMYASSTASTASALRHSTFQEEIRAARFGPAQQAPQFASGLGSLRRYYASVEARPTYEPPGLDGSTFSTAVEMAHQAVQSIAHRVDVFDKYPLLPSERPPPPEPDLNPQQVAADGGAAIATADALLTRAAMGPQAQLVRNGKGIKAPSAARLDALDAEYGHLTLAELGRIPQRDVLQTLTYRQYHDTQRTAAGGVEGPSACRGPSRLESPPPPEDAFDPPAGQPFAHAQQAAAFAQSYSVGPLPQSTRVEGEEAAVEEGQLSAAPECPAQRSVSDTASAACLSPTGPVIHGSPAATLPPAPDAAVDVELRRQEDEYAQALADLMLTQREALLAAEAGAGQHHAARLVCDSRAAYCGDGGLADPRSRRGQSRSHHSDVYPSVTPSRPEVRGAVTSPHAPAHSSGHAVPDLYDKDASPLGYTVRGGVTSAIARVAQASRSPIRPQPLGPVRNTPPPGGSPLHSHTSRGVFAEVSPRAVPAPALLPLLRGVASASGEGSPEPKRSSPRRGPRPPRSPHNIDADFVDLDPAAWAQGHSQRSHSDASVFSVPASDVARCPGRRVSPRHLCVNELHDLKWDVNLHRGVALSSDGREATGVPSNVGGHVAVATVPYDPSSHLAYSWTVLLLLNRSACKEVLVGLTGRSDTGNVTFVLRGDGCVVSELNGATRVRHAYAPALPAAARDPITVACSVQNGKMSFVINGREYGTAFDLPHDLVFFPMVVLSEPGEAACMPCAHRIDGC
eukprot:TRINITY_DN27828_c0_g1_i1.p1 TRINITY_DN27828_c0_g1~~TRINITY_DN27828_c0_g1_i1.p1  ORF type:complete len:801 (+),score=84.54 TRINITY_DN27828_c0_g1_i1:127-2529(+)